jgi:hypothetical protein
LDELGLPIYHICPTSHEKTFIRVSVHTKEKAGQWQYALLLFNSIEAQLQPDVISYTLALDACEAGGQGLHASSLLEAVPTLILWDAGRTGPSGACH